MQRSVYLKPVGFIAHKNAGEDGEGEVWGGIPLAGGPLAFMGLEIAERQGQVSNGGSAR